MNAPRIIGFALLAAGVGIIFFSLASSYLIFTGENQAPEIFLAPQTSRAEDLSFGSLQDVQEQLPQLLSEQVQGLLPQDAVPKMLNLAAWSILAGILIFGGAQLAGVGVKLIA